MLSHETDGAVLFCQDSFEVVISAFESTMEASGYTDEDPADVDVSIFCTDGGTCIALAGKKDFTLALGRALGRRLRREVRVLTASVIERSDDRFDCAVDDLTVRVDGSTTVGRWGVDLVSEHGDNWDDLCDGKVYFALSGLLTAAVEAVLPDAGEERRLLLHSPPSFGSPRLDDLVMRARLAERAELTRIGGRACVRLTSAGTTVTSFVDDAEAETLRGALGQ